MLPGRGRDPAVDAALEETDMRGRLEEWSLHALEGLERL